MRLRLFVVGLVTLLGQVVMLREVVVASFGSELIYLLAIGIQLLATAVGALIGRHDARDPELRVRALFLVWSLLLPALVAFARAARVIFAATPGAYLPFLQQIAAIAIALVPLGIAGGLLFTWAARAYVARGSTLASAYAIESAGSLAGGLASTLFVALGIQNLSVALLCAIFAALAAAVVGSDDRHRRLAGVAWCVVIALAVASDDAPRLDRETTAWSHRSLLDTLDTPYGRVTITGSHGQIAVFQNDALVFESEGTSAEELAHVAALQVEKPRSILVLGGAIEGIASELRKHTRAHIEIVELDARMVRLALRHMPVRDAGALHTRGTTLTFADPRRALERPARYDLIVSAMPEPDSGQANRFYTAEFFRLCAARLNPGGGVAFRLRSSENLWTPPLARRLASIDRALRSAFTDVIVLPGTANIVLASNQPLVRDPDELERRFRERGVEARLVSPRYVRYLLTNDRAGEIATLLARTDAPVNSDARPVCYRYTLALWLSRSYPGAARMDGTGIDAARGAIALAFVALALVLVARTSMASRRSLIVAIAGFTGMALECALILGYQMASGALYQDLGLLLATFMSGLTAGAWFVNAASTGAREGVPMQGRHGAALLVAIAVLSCLAAARLSIALPLDLTDACLMLLGAGFLTGALFAFASLWRVASQPAVVAPLYAADLLGGCAGSLAASLVLLPLFGIPLTLVGAGAVVIVALALL